MGCSQSIDQFDINLKTLKFKNVLNADFSQQDTNQRESSDKDDGKIFQKIGSKNRLIINTALAKAFESVNTQQQIKDQRQQKQLISSFNRYYKRSQSNGYQKGQKCVSQDSDKIKQQQYEWIIKRLKSHHLFKQIFQLESKYLHQFLLTVEKKTFSFRQYVYKQFDQSSSVYIVSQGKLLKQINSQDLKALSRGDFFGIQSIIYNSDQIQSVKVRSQKVLLYQINKNQVLKARNLISKQHKQDISRLFAQKIIFYNFLHNKQKQMLLSQTVKSIYSKGEIIFQNNYQSTSFFVIKTGKVFIRIPKKNDLILQQGNFGQSAFYKTKNKRNGTAMAYQDNTILYAIGSKAIFQTLGHKIDYVIFHNLTKWALYRDSQINSMYLTHKFDIQDLLHLFKIKKAQKYQALGLMNKTVDKIFINLTNQINYTKDLLLYGSDTVSKLFNQYLLKKQISTQIFYQNDIISTVAGNYAQAKVKDVIKFLAQHVQSSTSIVDHSNIINHTSIINHTDVVICTNLVNHKNFVSNNKRKSISLSIKNIESYIVLSQHSNYSMYLAFEPNFKIEHIVKVFYNKNIHHYHTKLFSTKIVQDTSIKTVQETSSKIVENTKVVEESSKFAQQIYKQAQNQREIISKLNHPYILGYYKSQHSKDCIYLLLQYIKGVTIRQVCLQLGILPKILIAFYILKISLLIDYLHKNNIIYRGLNMDKVLIDNFGYPHLFCFKKAKILSHQTRFRTNTIISTPHYIAPQMMKQDYSFQTDYWQIGVLLYEMIYNQLPFGNNANSPLEIYEQIFNKQPRLYKQSSNSLFKNLLQKDPSLRITKFRNLVKQQYFQNVEWQQIQRNKKLPPFIPKLTSQRFENLPKFQKRT